MVAYNTTQRKREQCSYSQVESLHVFCTLALGTLTTLSHTVRLVNARHFDIPTRRNYVSLLLIHTKSELIESTIRRVQFK